MDSFTLAVIIGMVAVLAAFVGLTLIDKGAPAKTPQKPR